MTVDSPQWNITLRGAPAELWAHLQRALNEGVEPPLEWGAAGPSSTGKSWGILGTLFLLAHEFPDVPVRVLICRNTRHSLTTSACVTLRKIFPDGHPMFDGAGDGNRTEYEVGRWRFDLRGLDKASKLYSAEYDIIYVMEAREISLAVWEEFARGVRNYAFYLHDRDGNRCEPGQGVSPIPFGMCLLDTNPDKPNHWIRQRSRNEGALELLATTRFENPAYYDDQGNPTPLGLAFERRMQLTTGVRYRKLWLGEWCSAEGVIWPEFNMDIHGVRLERGDDGWISRDTLKQHDIREFYGAMDFGWDNAGVLLVAGYTGDRKLIVIAEVYHSERGNDWWCDWIVKVHEHYPLTLVFCDHNAKGLVQELNDVVGAPREGPGSIFVLADKSVERGLSIVERRLSSKGNGPHVFFDHDMLLHPPDPVLLERRVPYCLIDCIPEYVRKRSDLSDDGDQTEARADQPDKTKPNTDGPDALRYLCVGVEYFEPDKKLVEPLNKAYRDRLRWLFKIRNGRLPDDGEDVTEPDDEDWIADEIRRSLHPD